MKNYYIYILIALIFVIFAIVTVINLIKTDNKKPIIKKKKINYKDNVVEFKRKI